MQLPKEVIHVLETLETAGYEGFAVGGCVRDTLLSQTPHDWDVCTNATPEQMLSAFRPFTCVPTGAKHGTVTVIVHGIPLEVTTYRTESEYRDGRHPDTVTFVSDITADLKRRDFTVNAMAYHPVNGLVDPFGGREDLKARVLRCVGDPTERFSEDALRILRAVRFAATYGFAVEPQTEQALFALAPTLYRVSAERVCGELTRLLTGDFVYPALSRLYPVLCAAVPELPLQDEGEREALFRALSRSEKDRTVRWAVWLAVLGESAAESVLQRLRLDRRTTQRILTVIRHQNDTVSPNEPAIRRWLYRLGEPTLRALLAVQEAYGRPQQAARACIDRVLATGQCISLKTLAVNGKDLLLTGIPAGEAVGKALQQLLAAVLDGTVPNQRDALLAYLDKRRKM